MKNLMFLIISLISLQLSAQQDAMFTKYMFNSIVAPKENINERPKGRLTKLQQLEYKIKKAERVDVTKKTAAFLGVRMKLNLKKKRTQTSFLKVTKNRNQKGVINSANGQIKVPITLEKGTVIRTQQEVALVHKSGILLGSSKVIDGRFNIKGLSITTEDSGEIYAIILNHPKDKLEGHVYMLLSPILFDALEPLDNPDPGGMMIP